MIAIMMTRLVAILNRHQYIATTQETNRTSVPCFSIAEHCDQYNYWFRPATK
jgi:hypothetical protein